MPNLPRFRGCASTLSKRPVSAGDYSVNAIADNSIADNAIADNAPSAGRATNDRPAGRWAQVAANAAYPAGP